MTLPTTKMGFEGQIYIGDPGSRAATLLENATDISTGMTPERGSTTVRGDGSVAPIETGDVTSRQLSYEWSMINDTTDTALQTILEAAYAGTGLALRTLDYAAGKGFDGDVTIEITGNMPLKGEQAYQFKSSPSRGYGRVPQPYV